MPATWHSVCWVSVVQTSSCLEEERTGERGGGRGKRARAAGAGMTRFCFSPDEGRAPWSSAGAKEGAPPSQGDSHTCSSSPTSWHGIQWEGRSTIKSQRTGYEPARERRRSSATWELNPLRQKQSETNSIRAKANERGVRLGGNEKLVIRHSWPIHSKLNTSQLQDELCSSRMFTLISSFTATLQSWQNSPHFIARMPSLEMRGWA